MRRRQKRPECPNCGQLLQAEDNYCGRCGQENHTHKLPLKHFVLELLESFLHFDTKVVRSLKDLFVPPGLITRNFNANKRARYMPPLRMYIFTSVVFFLISALITDRHLSREREHDATDTTRYEPDSLVIEMKGGVLRDSVITALSRHEHLDNATLDSALTAARIEADWMDRTVLRLAVNTSVNSAIKGTFISHLRANIGKLMFVEMPLFALLLYLLYIRRRIFYSEHLVFALHFHTVFFLLLILTTLGDLVTDNFPWAVLVPTGAIVFLLLALRTVYAQAWWKTVVKTLLLTVLYTLLLAVGVVVAAVVSSF